jgi:hypothetical protein
MKERLTVAEAAIRLGLSTEAVRQRIRRGGLTSEKINNRLYVVVSSSEDFETNESTPLITTSGETQSSGYQALIEQLQKENERIWDELAKRDEQIHRQDVLLRDALDWRTALTATVQSSSSPERTSTQVSDPVETSLQTSSKRRWWMWFSR